MSGLHHPEIHHGQAQYIEPKKHHNIKHSLRNMNYVPFLLLGTAAMGEVEPCRSLIISVVSRVGVDTKCVASLSGFLYKRRVVPVQRSWDNKRRQCSLWAIAGNIYRSFGENAFIDIDKTCTRLCGKWTYIELVIATVKWIILAAISCFFSLPLSACLRYVLLLLNSEVWSHSRASEC